MTDADILGWLIVGAVVAVLTGAAFWWSPGVKEPPTYQPKRAVR